jgi:hypothetical protein
MSRTFRRLTAVLILALLAGAGAAQAFPAAKAKGPERTYFEDPLTRAWSWVVAVVEKVGSFIDPNGGSLNPEPVSPVAPSDGAMTDVGSFIDPNGGN